MLPSDFFHRNIVFKEPTLAGSTRFGCFSQHREQVYSLDRNPGRLDAGRCEMPELPWETRSGAVPERDYVALLSYLPLNSGWRIPWLLLHAARIRQQLRGSSGLIGYSLRAQLAAKRFWTLSVWEDGAALHTFVAAPPHVAIMKALAPHMGRTRFARWTVKGSDLPPRWEEALKRGDATN